MANTISAAFVEQFAANVYHLSQQRGSRLGSTVRLESLTGNVHNFERISPVAAQLKPARHSDTPILDAPHSRRRVSPEDWEWGDLVDREDKLRLIISPESEYAIAGANSLGRAKDDIIISAFDADATAGDGSPVVFDPNNIVPVGGTGMTLDKVLAGIEIMNKNEVDEADRYIAYGSRQLRDILQIAEFTNQDFNVVRTLMNAQITTFLGLTWIRTERLPVPAADTRGCFMWQKQCMGLAVNEDMFARIAERHDKSFAHQVYCRMTMGATRIEEAGVVRVDCSEA